jgi:cell wall-associated NlpC family hydrolase
VTALATFVRAGRGRGPGVSPLLWRSRVIPGQRRARHVAVELPDGRRGWALAGDLSPVHARRPGLVERVQALFGVPYLWGGRSSAALDCSAFVQLVLGEQGHSLPRDAHEQFKRCVPLRAGESPRQGDLAFFSASRGRMGHVGIGLGAGYFAHSRGRVQIGSLDAGNPLCDMALAKQFRGWFRLGSKTVRRPRTGRRT